MTAATPPAEDPTLPTVLVVDEDPDWRALAELHVRLSPDVRLLGGVTTLPRAMDTIVLAEPDVVLVGLGRPVPSERDDLTLLRMLAPTTPLVVASVHGPEDARRRTGDQGAWYADKLEVFEVVEALGRAALSLRRPTTTIAIDEGDAARHVDGG